MLAPSPEQIALLTPLERRAFRAASLFAGSLKPLGTLYNRAVGATMVGLCASRRVVVEGLPHALALEPADRMVWVANHRSFFDFFVLFRVLFRRTRVGHRIFFPVRSTFFYDRPLGPLVNLVFDAFAMFPPILRDRERAAWNAYAMARCLAELDVPGTSIGMHPEGTRGRGPDPFALLPPKPGVGQLVLESSPEVKVMPAFVLGLGNGVAGEVRKNLLAPRAHPVHVRIGAPIDFSDLRATDRGTAQRLAAAERCMAAIAALGEPLRERMQARA
jgi:1-acyl-sn-glycerol-3-phosphate acyltransferase